MKFYPDIALSEVCLPLVGEVHPVLQEKVYPFLDEGSYRLQFFLLLEVLVLCAVDEIQQ